MFPERMLLTFQPQGSKVLCSSGETIPTSFSPSYTVFLFVFRHSSHFSSYPTQFFSHFPPLVRQTKHSCLPHLLLLSGFDLASELDIPALSCTATCIPVTFSNLTQTSFTSLVNLPAVGSKINGAETWFFLVLCQLLSFCSFSLLRSFSLQPLGL